MEACKKNSLNSCVCVFLPLIVVLLLFWDGVFLNGMRHVS